MDFSGLVDQFLIDNPGYKNDVDNFMEYFEQVRKLKIPDQEDFLVNGMTTEQVIQSLKYFIDKGQIKKQDPAGKYFVSIGQLFEYILNNSSYKNEDFLRELANPSTREDSYSKKTNNFIAEYNKLQPKEPLAKLEIHLIDDLIKWCDKSLKDEAFLKKMTDTEFKRVNATLCMKLMLFTGVTYRQGPVDKVHIERMIKKLFYAANV